MKTENRSLASLLISLWFLLSAALLFTTSFFMVFSAFLPLFAEENVDTSAIIIGVAFGTEALILFVATYLCFEKYLNYAGAETKVQPRLSAKWIVSLTLIASASILIGYFIADDQNFNWVGLPILTIPAVILPILLLLGLGTKKLDLGSRWRAWGIFGLGMTASPIILLFIEIVLLAIIVIGLIFVFIANPELTAELDDIMYQIQYAPDDLDNLIKVITPVILKPSVIFITLFFFAGAIPLVEELIKPIGVWMFAGKLDSPSQGFALGAVSGAAFALVETFNASGQPADWAGLLASRVGTGLLHITSSGLVGWGIVLAWKQRRYLKLVVLYVCAALMHAAWNGTVILYSFSTLAVEANPLEPFGALKPVTMAIAVLLAIIMFTVLIITNIKLRPVEAPISTNEPEVTPA